MNYIKIIIILLFLSSVCLAQEKPEKKYETSFGLNIGSNLSFVPDRKSYAIGGIWGAQVDYVNVNKGLGFYIGANYVLNNIGRQEGFDNGLNSDNIKILEVPVGIIYRLAKQRQDDNPISIKMGLSHALINRTHNIYVDERSYNIIGAHLGIAYRFLLGNKLGIEPNIQFKYMTIPDASVNETIVSSVSFIISQVN